MTNKGIGPSFAQELKAAGLHGLPFSWSPDGTLEFSDKMTEEQIASVIAVHTAHDPAKLHFEMMAKIALAESDITVIRCFESGISVPDTWRHYRMELRLIIVGASTPDAFPKRPAYPEGT